MLMSMIAMFAQSEPSTLIDLKGQQWKDSMGNDIGMYSRSP